MDLAPRSYRAICFDLDGTLLPMDIDEFMTNYFKRIGAYMVREGLDGARFMEGLNKGVKAMAMHTGDESNEQAFWDTFFSTYGAESDEERATIRACADAFYRDDFAHIGDGFQGNPACSRAIEVLADKGYPLLLTTMPMFPKQAVLHRLAWAGVRADAFARITTYENSTSVKPKPKYFAENLAAMGAQGSEVLMVGNNTMEDMDFMKLGADGYLVTDWLLNPIERDLATLKHGSMDDFEQWARELPVCENPLTDIQTGLVAPDEIERVLADNLVSRADIEEAARKAKAVVSTLPSEGDEHVYSRLKINE